MQPVAHAICPHAHGEGQLEAVDFISSRGGTLLVIDRGRDPSDPEGKMPWPLTKNELEDFQTSGLKEISFEDYVEDEDPPVRLFREKYLRVA